MTAREEDPDLGDFVPPAIAGVRFLPGLAWVRVQRCVFLPQADAASAAALVEWLPQHAALMFFDLHYGPGKPSDRDPGAYMRVWRAPAGSLWQQAGNHGWSSDWEPVSASVSRRA
jgi:hypothetical protein